MMDLVERVKWLCKGRRGGTVIEWLLMAALVAIVCATVVIALNAHGPGGLATAHNAVK